MIDDVLMVGSTGAGESRRSEGWSKEEGSIRGGGGGGGEEEGSGGGDGATTHGVLRCSWLGHRKTGERDYSGRRRRRRREKKNPTLSNRPSSMGWLYIHIHIMSICLSICLSTMYICMYVSISVCLSMCLFVCLYLVVSWRVVILRICKSRPSTICCRPLHVGTSFVV